jgi:putative two-component system response regulator
MNALTRFATAQPWPIDSLASDGSAEAAPEAGAVAFLPAEPWKVLIVHQDAAQRDAIRAILEPFGCLAADASQGSEAMAAARSNPCDLVVLQRALADMDGYEVCKHFRERPPKPHAKVILLAEEADLGVALAHGADDCIAAGRDLRVLSAKAQYLLRLKEAQDQAHVLARDLLTANRQLEDSLRARAEDVRLAHDALLFAMAKMAESRDGETAGHCRRLQLYARALGQQLAADAAWAGILHGSFLDMVERCVPLHDIGKIGLPDALLSKPGKLTPPERSLMETHTLIGASMLDALAREYGQSLGFLATATVIVRHHHERYDGQGYPDHLAGDAIPPAARMMALADVYDALRRKRFHKPAMAHEEAVRNLFESEGQFDPAVVQAFASCEAEFRRIYQQVRD